METFITKLADASITVPIIVFVYFMILQHCFSGELGITEIALI